MGLLDGGAAALFGEIFRPVFLPATLYVSETIIDVRGDPQRTLAESACRVQVNRATETMRRDPDFTSNDRALYVLGAEPAEGHEITVDAGPYAGTRWKIANPMDRDPAGAYVRCRAVLGYVTLPDGTLLSPVDGRPLLGPDGRLLMGAP